MHTTSRKAWLLRSAAALVVAGAGVLAAGPATAVAAGTAPARTTFTPATGAVLPGGAQLEHSKVDGGAGDHTLATPVEVTVAEDGAATVTTFSLASNVVVLACLGLLLMGVAAYALVAWSHEEPRAG